MPSMRASHQVAFLLAAIGAALAATMVLAAGVPSGGALGLKNAISDRTSTERL